MHRRRRRRRRLFAMFVCVVAVCARAASAQPAEANPTTKPANALISSGISADGAVHVVSSKALMLGVARPYKRLTIGNPDIASVDAIGPTQVLVTGHRAGETTLIIWDETNASQSVDVRVTAPAGAAAEAPPPGGSPKAKSWDNVRISESAALPGFVCFTSGLTEMCVPFSRIAAVVSVEEQPDAKLTRIVLTPSAGGKDLPGEVTIPGKSQSRERIMEILKSAKSKM